MVEYWINTIPGLTVMSAMEREREKEVRMRICDSACTSAPLPCRLFMTFSMNCVKCWACKLKRIWKNLDSMLTQENVCQDCSSIIITCTFIMHVRTSQGLISL